MTSKMSLFKADKNASGIIGRTAIRSSGRVGSLYDSCQDFVLEQLMLNIKEVLPEPDTSVTCELINGNTDKNRNLLRMIGIETDLRLNILLNPALRTGIAALIDHPHLFKEYTRFLHYTYVNRIEVLNIMTESTDLPESWNSNNTATHIITDVSWGIDVVIVLQLPPDAEIVAAIDKILEKVQAFLRDEQNDVEFSFHDEELFEKNISTKIYSNISDLKNITSVFTICQYIKGRSNQLKLYRPIKYLLKSIESLYPEYSGSAAEFSPLPSPMIDDFEQYLIQLSDTVKKLKHSLDHTVTTLLREHLKQRLCQMQQEWIDMSNEYEQELKLIQKVIINIHRSGSDFSEINQVLEYHTQTTLNNYIKELTRNLNELEIKGQLITHLHEEHFEYYNVAELNVNKENYEPTLLCHLIQNQSDNRILCSNDALNAKNQSELNRLRNQIIKEYKMNKNLRPTYADFSYCSFELPDMMILSSNENTSDADIQKQCASSSTRENIINILLLGESGVGKSTFINAFVNYLVFETLEKAESNKPVVLIPVSFFMTTGDHFEGRVINFGEFDNFNNEDFDHPGQSVTQNCKSYLFTLKHIDGTRLRIIDTPGFGDTRGLDQDDTNMQYILKYINNLTHLNAICFLFKPNTAQIHNYFSICLTQILDLLGRDARQNIIFCFTNARANFYTPGNTASLLRPMLDSLSINDIPFRKENTFCFDNESFRYLVALQNGNRFNNDEEKYEYELSWLTSLKESKRLVSYMNTQLKAWPLCIERQSIKHVQIEINQMIRPMLETMRNTLRHIILKDMGISNKSIKLRPIVIHRPASRCFSCTIHPIKIGEFLVIRDIPHEIKNKCHQCSCDYSRHSSIDYVLEYELLSTPSDYDQNQMDDMIQQLQLASNEFAYFLMQIVQSTTSDLFSIGFANMIFEENHLSQIPGPNNLNLKLVDNLKTLRDTYEQRSNEMNQNINNVDLSTIYKWIQKVRTYPEVLEQMDAIKKSQQILMKEYEYVVPEDLMK